MLPAIYAVWFAGWAVWGAPNDAYLFWIGAAYCCGAAVERALARFDARAPTPIRAERKR